MNRSAYVYVKTPTFGDFTYINPIFLPRIGEEICLKTGSTVWRVINVRHLMGEDEVQIFVENASNHQPQKKNQ